MKTTISQGIQLAIGAVVLGALVASGIPASAQNAGSLNQQDYRFVKEAAQGGMAEVRMGELALNRGASEFDPAFARE